MLKPTVIIEYCDECMYLKPALEAAQKILERYADRVEAVTLKPGHDGVFRVTANDALIIEMGDEGLPNAERVAQAVEQFLISPHPSPPSPSPLPPSPSEGRGDGGEGVRRGVPQGQGEGSP